MFSDEQEITELTIKCDDRSPADKWYYKEKAIEQDCVIKLDLFGTQYSVFKKQVTRLNLLRNLKRLKIHSNSSITTYDNYRLTLHLYRFEQLEQLDLDFELDDEGCDLSISHSNLKIVSIQSFFNDTNYLDLDTEKLEVLKFTGDFHRLDITYPTSIKHLTTPLYNSFFVQPKLTSFKNLEYLHGCLITQLDPIILTQLPKLKELKFVTKEDDYDLIECYDDYSNIKQMIIGFIRMKQTLQRKEPKLYFNDVPLTGVKQFKIFLRDEFPRFKDLDSDESMDEDDVNSNDEGMEVNDNNNGNNGEDNGGDRGQDVII